MKRHQTKIRLAIAGVGNCASSLLQGIYHYSQNGVQHKDYTLGLMHYSLGGYIPSDIEVVAAFDIDTRKVGRTLAEAAFAKPNCTEVIASQIVDYPTEVKMGPILDGVSEHMHEYPEDCTFRPSTAAPVDVAQILRDEGVEILVNYMPVGSTQAAQFYAQACLATEVSFINCMPVFIVSDNDWAHRFTKAGIPVVGDDIKSQLGSTILHRALAKLFHDRGVRINRTYQLNTGGNTDFLNMRNYTRLKQKKISKTEAVISQLNGYIKEDQVHIGPSDYVPWQKDNKVSYIRIEGTGFGGAPVEVEVRLSVEDSPNSAGVVIDAIRCCKLARDRGIAGPLTSVAAYMMKHPPVQMDDERARQQVEEFIGGERER
ncbi:MAG: inositol-3-phosphate synthase [Candidatus Omnitrophica bacterium]|nr:inositol-3-phosphate synthase [Candidatus Omnitrophota bacterium]